MFRFRINTYIYKETEYKNKMNTIRPQTQRQYNYNNNVSFGTLKRIEYIKEFNPHEYIEDAKAVLAFKKSEAFNKFFQNYDGIAIFDRGSGTFCDRDFRFSDLTIKYKKAFQTKPEKNLFKRGMQNIKKWFSNNMLEEQFEDKMHYYASYDPYSFGDSRTSLTDMIKNLTINDLEAYVKSNKKKEAEQAQKAELLKKLNDEINKLG